MPDRATAKEKRDYWAMRDAGVPPERAANYVGRSRSWAYLQEQEKKDLDKASRARGAARHARSNERLSVTTFQDAVDLISAIAAEEDEKAFELFDKHEAGVIPMMAEVARFLAHCRAIDLQNSLLEIHEGEEWEQEIRDNPITTDDILQSIPVAIARHDAGRNYNPLQPPRADEWERRLMETHPEFKELADQVDAAYKSDNPEAAMRELRQSIREQVEDEEPEAVSVNGHD